VLMSSVLLDDGSRQILRFLFPGDVIALSSLVYREMPETLTAPGSRGSPAGRCCSPPPPSTRRTCARR